jgi:hypothetical protein
VTEQSSVELFPAVPRTRARAERNTYKAMLEDEADFLVCIRSMVLAGERPSVVLSQVDAQLQALRSVLTGGKKTA